MDPPAQVLEYAATPRWYRRRRWRRAIVAALLVVVVAAGAWQRDRLVRKFKIHYYQRLCAGFTAARDHVAMEWDPDLAKPLVNAGKDYVGGAFFAYDGLPAVFIPQRLRELLPAATSGSSDAIAMLHERTSAGGTRRLVIVRISSFTLARDEPDGKCSILGVSAASIPRVGWLDWDVPAEQVTDAGEMILTRNSGDLAQGGKMEFSRRTRVFSGQLDPSDRSRFSIDYIICGQRDTIDGQLMDDGSVRLKPRSARIVANDPNADLWDNLPTDPQAATSRRPPTTTQVN